MADICRDHFQTMFIVLSRHSRQSRQKNTGFAALNKALTSPPVRAILELRPMSIDKRVLDAIRQLGAEGGRTAAKNMTKAQRLARAKKAGAASGIARAARAAARVRKRK